MKSKFKEKMLGLVSRGGKAPQPPEDILKVSRQVEAIIDGVVNQVFTKYSSILMARDLTFIVPAVWGASKEAELTATQMEIHESVGPRLNEALGLFDLDKLEPAQGFAVGYFIRSLMVTKIVYMIEASKRRQAEMREAATAAGVLDETEPMGQA